MGCHHKFVCPVIVHDVKITSASSCNILSESWVPWFYEIPPSLRRNEGGMIMPLLTMLVLPNSILIASLVIHGDKLMTLPQCSPDLNRIENIPQYPAYHH